MWKLFILLQEQEASLRDPCRDLWGLLSLSPVRLSLRLPAGLPEVFWIQNPVTTSLQTGWDPSVLNWKHRWNINLNICSFILLYIHCMFWSNLCSCTCCLFCLWNDILKENTHINPFIHSLYNLIMNLTFSPSTSLNGCVGVQCPLKNFMIYKGQLCFQISFSLHWDNK